MTHNLPAEVLSKVSQFIDGIFVSDDFSFESMTPQSMIETYTVIYEYLTNTRVSDRSTANHRNAGRSNGRANNIDIGPKVTGEDLYNYIVGRVKEKVTTRYETVKYMTEEKMLEYYKICYEHFERQCQKLGAACNYLDRHWVHRKYDSGNPVLTVEEYAKDIWEKNFFQPLFPCIRQICLDLIKTSRLNHSSIPTQKIKNILQLYMDKDFLRIIHTNSDNIYAKLFEDFDDFYRAKKQELPPFQEDQIVEYLTSIASYFEYEIKNIQPCLPDIESTWPRLITKLEELFLPDEIFEKIKDFISIPNEYQNLENIYSSIRFIEKIRTQLILLIEQHIKNLFENISQARQNGEILQFYTDHWNQYKSPDEALDRICSFSKTHWINLAVQAELLDINKLFCMILNLWKSIVFQPICQQLTDACLQLIESDRNNQSIDTNRIRQIIESYVVLDSDLIVYREFFERKFLQNTEEFYRLEAERVLAQNSVTEYLRKVAQRLDEEAHRVQSYLHSSTFTELIKKVEEILIYNQLDIIYDESEILLKDQRYQDLTLLYKLVNRIPNATKKLESIVENYISQMGISEIEPIGSTAINDPKVYVETLIEFHKKYLRFVGEVFADDQGFINALDQACGKFINDNAVIKTAGSTRKSAELLARYCDILLRKSSTVVEEKFNEIMIVFNYIQDKDAYEKFYRKMLAKRLVGQLSASNDNEELMISKLKQACGFEYTSKVQQMFQDISISKTLTTDYEKYRENHHITHVENFSVMVLHSNSWPFSASSNFILPDELKRSCDRFTEFYNRRHNGRKLIWLHQYSKGELQTCFTSPKYTLQVSTYQMAVLLLFTESLTWTVERIADKTQIEFNLLSQILLILLESKLLICPDIKDNEIKSNYSIRLATDFSSKKLRINLNMPIKVVEQKDMENIHRSIDEDRKMVIQAAIVRIMKAKQTLKYALLTQEVIQQLSSRFQPRVPDIKKCIDILIEHKYLERQQDDSGILRYI